MSRPPTRSLVVSLPRRLALDCDAALHQTTVLQRVFDGPGGKLPGGR